MELYETTQKNYIYLEDENYVQVVEMWECHWQHIKKQKAIQQFQDKMFEWVKPSCTKNARPTEAQDFKDFEDETFFGLVECDI